MKNLFRFTAAVFLISMVALPLFGAGAGKEDWSDLFEGEKKVYGSEKEEKFPVNMGPFGEKEQWADHYSCMILSFFKYSDYPNYSRTYVLPFYYSIKSKLDNREKTWGFLWPGLYYYHRIDGARELTVHVPFYYSSLTETEKDRSILYLIWWGSTDNKNDGINNSYYGIYPLFNRSINKNVKTGYEKSKVAIYPLLFYWRQTTNTFNGSSYSNTFNIWPLWFYNSNSTADSKIDTTTFGFPVIPLFYYHSSPDRGHVNFLWALDFSWNRKDDERSLKRFWLMPLFFHRAGPDGYTHVIPPVHLSLRWPSGEYYWHLLPPLLWSRRSIDHKYNYKTEKSDTTYYDSFLSLLFSHYTVHKGEKKWDEKPVSRTFWFPLIPVYYYHTEPEKTHVNALWLIDLAWRKKEKGDELYRFWVMPFLFHKPGDNGYTHVLPPVFVNNRYKTGEYYTHLLPLFMSWKSSDTEYSYKTRKNEKVYSDSFMSPLFADFKNYRGVKKWEDNPESRTLWAPLIPLYYYHTEPGKTHVNALWLIDLAWRKKEKGDELYRFWLMPVVFHKPGDNGYTHVLPPVYIYNRYKTGEYYMHGLPVFMSWKSIDSTYNSASRKYEKGYSDSVVSLAYASFNDYKGDKKWDEKPYNSTFWAPLIPLFYYHTEPGKTHVNALWLIDLAWRKKEQGNELYRLWAMPFLFYKPGDRGYTHVFPPLFVWDRNREGDYYIHAFPFFMRNKKITDTYNYKTQKYDRTYSDSIISPLFVSLDKTRGGEKWDGESVQSRFWAPIIPLYYKSKSNEGTHYNIAWILDWKEDMIGSVERFWLFPFVFRKSGEGGYRHYIPFYMRPAGWTEERGFSWGLFHYNSWSPEKNVTWAWLYYNRDNLKGSTYYTHLLPFYLSWKTKERLIHYNIAGVPWQFRWEDEKKSVRFNILGFSKTAAINPFTPGVSLDFGRIEGDWYFDTDLSWLYNIVSLSNRITITNPFKKKADIRVTDLENQEKLTEELKVDDSKPDKIKGPEIGKKTEVSRDNSRFFFGFELIFGWFAYERADTKRHLRLIPLGWLTWDKDSDDKLFVIPLPVPIVSYRSQEGDSSYLVVFPFFGNQVVKKSYKYAALLNVFWYEYDDDEKETEVTALWPVFNWYSSPKRSGWRIFPLMWRKKYSGKGAFASTFISPIHYSRYKTDESGNVDLYKFVLNPVYHSKMSIEGDSTYERSFVPAILPIFGHLRHERTNAPEDVSNSMIKSGGRSDSLIQYESTDRKWFFPLAYKSEKTEVSLSGKRREEFSMYGLPFLYYSSLSQSVSNDEDKVLDIKSKRDDKKADTGYRKDYTFFLLGFYRDRTSDVTENSLFFGLYRNTYNASTDDTLHQLLWGLIRHASTKESTRFWLLPLTYYYNSQSAFEFSILMGLYKYESLEPAKKQNPMMMEMGHSSWKLFWGLIYTSRSYETVSDRITNFSAVEVKDHTSWFIPLYYYNGNEGLKKKYSYSKHVTLWYKKYEEFEDGGKTAFSSTFWFPIIPLVYRHATQDSTHWNLLGLIDWKSSPGYSRTFFLPFFYTSADKTRSHTNVLLFIDFEKENGNWDNLWVFPFYVRYWGANNEDTKVILGTYWYTSKDYERQNLLYIFDHKRYNSRDFDSYGLLFHSIKYESSPELTRMRLLWGALMSYEKFTKTGYYDHYFALGLSGLENNSRFYKNYIFPLWYYKKYHDESRGWYCVSPVTLSYFSKDKNGDFDLGVLGLLYYRNNNIPAKEDRRMILLGTLFNEVRSPERGYHSIGSFWGLLWEHEVESETDFIKTTVLKGLYKRVEYKGEVKNKYFWIF